MHFEHFVIQLMTKVQGTLILLTLFNEETKVHIFVIRYMQIRNTKTHESDNLETDTKGDMFFCVCLKTWSIFSYSKAR